MTQHEASPPTYKTVDGLERGLIVLRELNRQRGASVNDLAKATSINRTTIYRIMETLIKLGYAQRSSSDGRFYTTSSSRELSDGFDDDAWVAQVGAPELAKLHKKIVWPCDILTLEGDSMVVRETTYRISPLSIYRSTIGSRWPMMASASGRAYLAFCGTQERAELVQLLRRTNKSKDVHIHSDAFLASIVNSTRKAGYGSSVREVNDNISAISVPICRGTRVLACISVVFMSRAMSISECAAKFLPDLNQAARNMEERLGDWDPDSLHFTDPMLADGIVDDANALG